MKEERKQKSFKLPNRDTWVKSKLRMASLRWPARSEALKRARKDRGKYQCYICKDLFPSQKIHLDHVEPVIPLDHIEFDWNSFIKRLFCDVEGFQVLCTVCHDAKTALEDQMRMFYKGKRKKNVDE